MLQCFLILGIYIATGVKFRCQCFDDFGGLGCFDSFFFFFEVLLRCF